MFKSIASIIIIFSITQFGCSSHNKRNSKKKYNPELAIKKNNVAYQLYQQYLFEEEKGKIFSALDSIDLAISLDSTNPSFYYNKSTFLISMDSLKLAADVLMELIKKDSSQVDAYMQRGFIYEKIGNPELAKKNYLEALDIYNKMLSEDIDNVNIMGNRAFIYMFIFSKEQALNEVEKLLKAYPENGYLSNIKKEIQDFTKESYIEYRFNF